MNISNPVVISTEIFVAIFDAYSNDKDINGRVVIPEAMNPINNTANYSILTPNVIIPKEQRCPKPSNTI